MKNRFIHPGKTCVDVDLYWIFETITDKMTDKATIDIVKSKYIAISGTEIDVSGIIWATKKSNVITKVLRYHLKPTQE